MGFKRAFKKIGSGFLKGLKVVGKTAAKIDDIPGAGEVLGFIPVAGPVLRLAVERAATAEEMFSAPGSGDQKIQWVLHQLAKDLRDLGVEEKRIRGLAELALLFHKGEAGIVAVEDSLAGLKKQMDRPSEKKRESLPTESIKTHSKK